MFAGVYSFVRVSIDKNRARATRTRWCLPAYISGFLEMYHHCAVLSSVRIKIEWASRWLCDCELYQISRFAYCLCVQPFEVEGSGVGLP